jgi:hypothetical protein
MRRILPREPRNNRLGRRRATAAFPGTRTDAPSQGGFAGVLVSGPVGVH